MRTKTRQELHGTDKQEQSEYNQYAQRVNSKIGNSSGECIMPIQLYENSKEVYRIIAAVDNKDGKQGFVVVIKKPGRFSVGSEMKFSVLHADRNWTLSSKGDLDDSSYTDSVKRVLRALDAGTCHVDKPERGAVKKGEETSPGAVAKSDKAEAPSESVTADSKDEVVIGEGWLSSVKGMGGKIKGLIPSFGGDESQDQN